MAECIEKNKVVNLLTALENECQQFKPFEGFEHAMYRKLCETEIAIGKLPAADVAPVVRCKDCEWFMREHGCPIEASGYHKGGRNLPVENDFCSYGERRDGGVDNV